MSNATFVMTLMQTVGLQFFAEAGDYVNGKTQMIDAYNSSNNQNRTSANSMNDTLKQYYDTELLENYRMKRMYSQFGKKVSLPARHNGTIEFRKWNTFAKASALQEGIIPTGQTFGMTKINGSIDQYGTYTAITDVLELQAYDDVIAGATEEMGASAAETEETLLRNALLTNTNVQYCRNINKSTGAAIGNRPTSCATMKANDTDGWAILTPSEINYAVTTLKKNKAPTINGKYFLVAHPSVLYNLRESKDWIEVHKYAATTEIFNGEVGEIHGCRVLENVDAPILKGSHGTVSYTNGDSGCTYACYMFGKDSFGMIDPDGGNLTMIIKDKSEVGGPLDQFSTIGYKFMTGTMMLYPERMLRVMCVSDFSATDTDNY